MPAAFVPVADNAGFDSAAEPHPWLMVPLNAQNDTSASPSRTRSAICCSGGLAFHHFEQPSEDRMLMFEASGPQTRRIPKRQAIHMHQQA
jgi:hypothetical protein